MLVDSDDDNDIKLNIALKRLKRKRDTKRKSLSNSTKEIIPEHCNFCDKNLFVRTWCSSCKKNHYLCRPCWNHKKNYKDSDKEFMCYDSRNVCFDCGKASHLISNKEECSIATCKYHPYIWCVRKKNCGHYNVCGVCEEDLLEKFKGLTIDGKQIHSYNVFKFFDKDNNKVCDIDTILQKDMENPRPIHYSEEEEETPILPSPFFFNQKKKVKKIVLTKKNVVKHSTPSRYKARYTEMKTNKQVCRINLFIMIL